MPLDECTRKFLNSSHSKVLSNLFFWVLFCVYVCVPGMGSVLAAEVQFYIISHICKSLTVLSLIYYAVLFSFFSPCLPNPFPPHSSFAVGITLMCGIFFSWICMCLCLLWWKYDVLMFENGKK
jgi:hypothetical protein